MFPIFTAAVVYTGLPYLPGSCYIPRPCHYNCPATPPPTAFCCAVRLAITCHGFLLPGYYVDHQHRYCRHLRYCNTCRIAAPGSLYPCRRDCAPFCRLPDYNTAQRGARVRVCVADGCRCGKTTDVPTPTHTLLLRCPSLPTVCGCVPPYRARLPADVGSAVPHRRLLAPRALFICAAARSCCLPSAAMRHMRTSWFDWLLSRPPPPHSPGPGLRGRTTYQAAPGRQAGRGGARLLTATGLTRLPPAAGRWDRGHSVLVRQFGTTCPDAQHPPPGQAGDGAMRQTCRAVGGLAGGDGEAGRRRRRLQGHQ